MFFTLIVLPAIVLFSNQDIFFVMVAIFLLVTSIKNLYQAVISPADIRQNEFEDIFEDYNEDEDLNPENITVNTKIVKNLIIILFYIYCTFFIYSFIFKAFVYAIILYWLYDTINPSPKTAEAGSLVSDPIKPNSNLRNILSFFVNTGTIIMIVFVTCNKFIRRII
jgi:hypothetical protein